MSTKLLGIVVILSVAAALTYAPIFAAQESEVQTDPEGLVPPRVILKTQKPPVYPPAAKAARYSGSVLLETTVLKDGTVGNVSVVECTMPKVGFEGAATDAVKKWRFHPGQMDDKPVEVTLKFRVNFDPSGISIRPNKEAANSFQTAEQNAVTATSQPGSSQVSSERSGGGP